MYPLNYNSLVVQYKVKCVHLLQFINIPGVVFSKIIRADIFIKKAVTLLWFVKPMAQCSLVQLPSLSCLSLAFDCSLSACMAARYFASLCGQDPLLRTFIITVLLLCTFIITVLSAPREITPTHTGIFSLSQNLC